MLAHAGDMMRGLLGAPAHSALDTMKPTGDMGNMMGGLMKMVGGASRTSAPGAAATVGFTTDTTHRGPWDRAALVHGTQLLALRHDVFVAMDLQSADYARAKALLAAICARL